jgi:hypothetical protein
MLVLVHQLFLKFKNPPFKKATIFQAERGALNVKTSYSDLEDSVAVC